MRDTGDGMALLARLFQARPFEEVEGTLVQGAAVCEKRIKFIIFCKFLSEMKVVSTDFSTQFFSLAENLGGKYFVQHT